MKEMTLRCCRSHFLGLGRLSARISNPHPCNRFDAKSLDTFHSRGNRDWYGHCGWVGAVQFDHWYVYAAVVQHISCRCGGGVSLLTCRSAVGGCATASRHPLLFRCIGDGDCVSGKSCGAHRTGAYHPFVRDREMDTSAGTRLSLW